MRPVRIQVDNSVRYNVHLVVLENESYLEIKDRFKKTMNIVPVARKKIPVKVHFYKSQWLYRKWSGCGYGHVNIELPDGNLLNYDLKEEECGLIGNGFWYLTPDKTVDAFVTTEDLQKAIKMTRKPLCLWSIFSRNCFTIVATALGGSKKEDVTKLLRTQNENL